jgi:hypothetical protein
MTDVDPRMKVPMPVKIKIGRSWGCLEMPVPPFAGADPRCGGPIAGGGRPLAAADKDAATDGGATAADVGDAPRGGLSLSGTPPTGQAEAEAEASLSATTRGRSSTTKKRGLDLDGLFDFDFAPDHLSHSGARPAGGSGDPGEASAKRLRATEAPAPCDAERPAERPSEGPAEPEAHPNGSSGKGACLAVQLGGGPEGVARAGDAENLAPPGAVSQQSRQLFGRGPLSRAAATAPLSAIARAGLSRPAHSSSRAARGQSLACASGSLCRSAVEARADLSRLQTTALHLPPPAREHGRGRHTGTGAGSSPHRAGRRAGG